MVNELKKRKILKSFSIVSWGKEVMSKVFFYVNVLFWIWGIFMFGWYLFFWVQEINSDKKKVEFELFYMNVIKNNV